MTKWEYKHMWIDIHMSPVLTMSRWGVTIPGEKKRCNTEEGVAEYINKFGAEGWELVNVINGSDNHGIITKAILFFKRPAAQQGEGE